jgi:hypothetical protein
MASAITREQADELAAQLEVSLDDGICFACLSFVSFPLELGDSRELAGALRRMTPDIWDDGLDVRALRAARRARMAGVPRAAEGLADLERRGGRSVVARALVLRLAGELSRRSRARSTRPP